MRIHTLLVACMLVANDVNAQTTSDVGHYERPLQLEAAIGADFPGNDPYCCSGRAWVGSVGVRWDPTGYGAFRAGVLGMDRNSRFSYNSGTDSYEMRERFVALTASFDAFFRIAGSFGVAISTGAGLVPWANGRMTTSSAQTYPANYLQTDRGYLLTGSVSARYRWFFIEQHALILGGAQDAIRNNREIFPVSLGVRF
jgi:hypothetical protein